MAKKDKVKKFVKDHKKGIILTGVTTVVAVAGAVVLKKVLGDNTVKMPGFTIEGPFTVGDLGRLGEEYMKHDPELAEDTPVLSVGKFVFG